MSFNEQLVPISYHLRNFNKYLKLDLPASTQGNLTLIGENAVGKTTLANCFYPMLIDGSIATPSFNPAKEVAKINKTTNPQNSARDERNFESMMLGWGTGAMQTRVGYTYMRLRSQQRQVILGIGARRTVGDKRRATWWFVVNEPDPAATLPLTTTTATGASLTKDEFIAANAALESKLVVFDKSEGYRDYVASKIYGFANPQQLGHLAQDYRILASPILTAGNAKFTPILAALQNAQEGIDHETIDKIADSFREVNQENGLLERVKHAQKRLQSIKKEIFWRNLNHLQELTLDQYSQLSTARSGKMNEEEAFQSKISELEQQIQLASENQQAVTTQVDQLQQQQAHQQQMLVERSHLEQMQADIERALAQYRRALANLQASQKLLTDIEAQQQTNQTKIADLNEATLKPLQAQLASKTASLHELAADLSEISLIAIVRKLRDYLDRQEKLLTKYRGISDTQKNLGVDVALVKEMAGLMDTSIDQRVHGSFNNRTNEGLHDDNHAIHTAGAAKMDEHYARLQAEQDQLVKAHPDLRVYLTHPDLLAQLRAVALKLAQGLKQLAQYQQRSELLATQATNYQQQIDQAKGFLDPNFDMAQQESDLQKLAGDLATLVIDETLAERLARARQQRQSLDEQLTEFNRQRATVQGEQRAGQRQIQQLSQQLTRLAEQTARSLKTLAPYTPAQQPQLTDIESALNFVQKEQSHVRNSSYAEISNQIGKLIHRNNADGIDENALDVLFDERGHSAEASAMTQQRSIAENQMTIVAFDLNQALAEMATDRAQIEKSLVEKQTGQNLAQTLYFTAAINQIARQYQLVDSYNEILTAGTNREQKIRLRVSLQAATVAPAAIEEACDPTLTERPNLLKEVTKRLKELATDTEIADDDEAFYAQANEKLDTRGWSVFKVWIKRWQSGTDQFEEVTNKFVQSGGSRAEKAQAMVLPLLLVPKMVLNGAKHKDAPHLVMFDEFADKLDPETAKVFARTIARFGFNFIATMPAGAQNKILADGVDNIAYNVIAPQNQADGKFHLNQVTTALIWQQEVPR